MKRKYIVLNRPLDLGIDILLHYANQFSSFFWMDSHNYSETERKISFSRPGSVLGLGDIHEGKICPGDLEELGIFMEENPNEWLLGYLSYELKNDLEKLSSITQDKIGFGKLDFFIPRYILIEDKSRFNLGFFPELEDSDFGEEQFYSSVMNSSPQKKQPEKTNSVQPDMDEATYLEVCNKVLNHIQRGDIYEMNLCIHFHAENATIDPVHTYLQLNHISASPFSGMLKRNNRYLICSSPERYLAGNSEKIISQPIKGTRPRSTNPKQDLEQAEALKSDPKERAENIMIVDLVRNDLSKVALPASVQVDELCEVYAYPRVWQMTSTISCNPKSNTNLLDYFKATFPMGSMTGAPKVRAMQLIDHFEKSARGLYSGSMGFITPDGNFDFNVVIRSILYNAESGALAFSAGSAITSMADPVKEYQECMLKAEAMAEALDLDLKKQNYES